MGIDHSPEAGMRREMLNRYTMQDRFTRRATLLPMPFICTQTLHVAMYPGDGHEGKLLLYALHTGLVICCTRPPQNGAQTGQKRGVL
jgi:hypothetical protein